MMTTTKVVGNLSLTKQEIQSILDIEDIELRNKMFIMKVKKYSMYGLGQFGHEHRGNVHNLLTEQQEWFKIYLELINKKES